MTIKRTLVVIVLLSLLGLAASLWAYPRLPDQVPSHWNIAGEVDDTKQRDTIVYLLPGLGLVLGLLLLYIPYIDPLRANVERFRSTYNWFIVGMSLFFLFLHVLTILAGLGIRFNMTDMLIPAASAMVIGIGYVLERTKPNWFLGIRTPWTLSSSTVWDKTHRLGGLLFKLSGVTMLTGLLFSQEAAFFLLMGSILITTLVTIVYSYFAYRDEQMQAQNP
jgi:uncharacterized membrane protein